MFNSGDTAQEIVVAIGRRIRDLRLSRGITQEELAKRIGASKRAVERIEGGVGSPRLELLVSICIEMSLVGGFDTLLPAVRLSPLEILRGKELPKRARKSRRLELRWGDES